MLTLYYRTTLQILKALNTLRVQAFGVQYALSGYTPEDIVIRSKLKIIDMAVRVKNPLFSALAYEE